MKFNGASLGLLKVEGTIAPAQVLRGYALGRGEDELQCPGDKGQETSLFTKIMWFFLVLLGDQSIFSII